MTFQRFPIFRKRFVTCLRVLVLFVLSLMYLAISSLRPEMSKLISNLTDCIEIKSSKNGPEWLLGAPSGVGNLKRVPRWQFSPQMNNLRPAACLWCPDDHCVSPSSQQAVIETLDHIGTDSVCCWQCSCLLVSVMTSQCHKPQADNGSPSVWLEPSNKTTNNNHFGGKSGVARASSNWTGGILRHFIGFRYKQDPRIGWDGRVLGRPSQGKMSDIRGILLSSHKINWKLISRF